MAKKKRNWQTLGFKSYREYQQFQKKAKLQSIFNECLQEAAAAHQTKEQNRERQHQEATDRLKYHQLRQQGLR